MELHPDAKALHEGHRFPDSNAEQLIAIFNHVRLLEVEATPLETATHFTDFDDYWKPFLGGQGPAPTYVSRLEGSERTRLRETLKQRLPVEEDGSIALSARAWAAKGIA